MVFLTSEAVNHRRPLFFLLLFWLRAVLSVHLADRSCAFSLDLRVELLVEQNLVHQVWLHGAGLCGRFRGPIVVSWNEEREVIKYTCE